MCAFCPAAKSSRARWDLPNPKRAPRLLAAALWFLKSWSTTNQSADNTTHRTSGDRIKHRFLLDGGSQRACTVPLKRASRVIVICLSMNSEADFDPDSYKMPYVVMALSKLTSEVHRLLESHDGTLSLLRSGSQSSLIRM